MALLDKILGRDWQWYLESARKKHANGEGALALEHIAKAAEMAPEREEIKDTEREIRRGIFEQACDRVRKAINARSPESAESTLELAEKFAQNAEDKKLIDDFRQQIEDMANVSASEQEIDDMPELAMDDRWNLMLNRLSFAQADKYESYGEQFKLAWLDMQDGKINDAVKAFKDTLKKFPDEAYIYAELGQAQFAVGENADAAESLARADAELNDVKLKLLLADVYWAMNNVEKAEEVLQAAYDKDPEDLQVLVQIVIHSIRTKEFESGFDAMEVLEAEAPNDYSISRLKGQLEEAAGRIDDAIKTYEKVNQYIKSVAVKTGQNKIDLTCADGAARLYIDKGENLDRAVDLLKLCENEHKGHAEKCVTFLRMAIAYHKMGNASGCTDALDTAQVIIEKLSGEERRLMTAQYFAVCDMCEMKDRLPDMSALRPASGSGLYKTVGNAGNDTKKSSKVTYTYTVKR